MSTKEKNNARPLHMGKMVYAKIQEKRFTCVEVSRRIQVSPSTLMGYFDNPSLQSRIIQKLCVALEYNFFEDLINVLPEHIQYSNEGSKRKQEIDELKRMVEEQKKEIGIYKELLSRKL